MGTEKLFTKELVYKIVSALYKVHKALGCGFPEKVYLRAVEIELKNRQISYRTEKEIPICYENNELGFFKLDLVVEDKIVIKLKAVDRLSKAFRYHLVSHLNASPYETGLLVNFGSAQMDLVRVDKSRQEKTFSLKA